MSCNANSHSPSLACRNASHETEWPWPDWFRDLAPAIARMWQKRSERQRLLMLDQHLLNDIGITRAQAEKEAGKWMWD
jgi:uncharacterized protein YjiS (DUF1127 family)